MPITKKATVTVPRLMSTKEVAKLFRITPAGARYLLEKGELRGGRFGRSMLFDGQSVVDLLRSRGISAELED